MINTTDAIYSLFQTITDGEEFDSDDAAISIMQVAYDDLLSQRDWYFLNKTVAVLSTSLTLPTDCAKVLRLWLVDSAGNVSSEPLQRTTFEKRYENVGDYYINEVSKTIVFLESFTNCSFILDYKYRPNRLGFNTIAYSAGPPIVEAIDSVTVIPSEFVAVLAFYMKKQYKSADENYDFYKETGIDFLALEQKMIDDDASRKNLYVQS